MGSRVPSGRFGPLLCEGAASQGGLVGESMLSVSYPFGSSTRCRSGVLRSPWRRTRDALVAFPPRRDRLRP
eukprot:1036736-Pyramimonas_sp.AAC.1